MILSKAPLRLAVFAVVSFFDYLIIAEVPYHPI
jgi:hypothetical protein